MKILSRLAIAFVLVLSMTVAACEPADEEPVEETPSAQEGDMGDEGEMGEDEGAAGEEDDEGMADDEGDEMATDRTGAWFDELVVVEEENADAAVSRLEQGDIDVYAFTISSPQTYAAIQDSETLDHKTSYGSYTELTFNPSQCSAENQLNPFAVPRIREAMNWLVDREYIIAEIMGGLGTPRYVPINGASADRGRLAAEIRAIEAEYAYDAERAEQVVTEEMEALGAERVDGEWTYNGEPVEIIGIIRTEDERRQIGDYFANQLTNIGFTVAPDYRTSAEAAPIWQQSDPTECQFHYYTGGWVSTSINRDASSNFNFFYTPSGLPRPLWQAYTPTEEFAELAQRLDDSDYSSMEQRTDLFAEALPLALEDSSRVWLLDRSSVAPLRDDIEVSSDLSGSIYGSDLWPYTLRRNGEVGGSITWASASILTEPWNPVAGTNWIYDSTLIGATGQSAYVSDPNTGLAWPQRVGEFNVTAQQDLPVSKTHDWVTLDFVEEIVVPDDAWADWDAGSQTFVPASEFYTETQTALVRTTTTYPDDFFETTMWHDGSQMTPADMVMSLILNFDVAKEASEIYDEAQVPALDSFMSTFKGIRITSLDPFTVEYYTDDWSLDAENSISDLRALWPQYGFGEAPWHAIAIGYQAEVAGRAAFSADKATANEIEQLSYIAGPTLEILGEQLESAAADATIPYSPTMSEYITADEAADRYANLQSWNDDKGHFWVGTGPLYLEEAFPVEGTVLLRRNEDYPDAADRWSRFSEPQIADVEVEGAGRVTAGEEATFDVMVTFDGLPYAQSDIEEVKYLAFDANNDLVATGPAEAVEDGMWQVTLSGDETGAMEAGAGRLEIVVVSNLVALPSLGALEFVVTP